MSLLKKIAAKMPHRWQTEFKRIHFSRQIKKGSFRTKEAEYKVLQELIKEGDWVIDVGANVGHYSKRFSELVGKSGRVISFEPVPTTFSLLAANVQVFACHNVTLINAAVSDKLSVVGMSIPQFSSGLTNYYRAEVASAEDSELSVLTLSIDSLGITQPVALIKIDAEGHEAFVLGGMKKLIEASKPILIVETDSEEVIADLVAMGYTSERFDGSSNVVFRPAT